MPKEFAPGIPISRAVRKIPTVKRPRVWEYGVHAHRSEGPAKEHFDLRLGDPRTGHAHSWAMKHLPKPGEKRLAVQQPTHTLPYMDFSGAIESGYGKGQVELAQRDKMEVLRAGPGEVRFNVYRGKGQDEFLLKKTKNDQWLVHNVTPTRKSGPTKNLPSSKPKYKTVAPEKIDVDDPATELQAKIDGAHVLYQFKGKGTTPRIFSYRPTSREAGVIDHTQKLPGFEKRKTPAALRDTILRGELYATDESGKALPAARIGGILNASVWKSREKQKEEGKLKPVVFDVVRYKGKDVADLPFSKKRKLVAEATRAAPWLRQPRTAKTPAEKRKLIDDIKSGREPSTDEGVVEWRADRAVPRKSKFHEERDVFLRGAFAEQGKKRSGTMAGGFEYSYTKNGPIVGRVGTGMSHGMKKDMLDNPDKYEGLKARIMTQRAPEGYKPRMPVFHSFHLDQDIPETAKTAADVIKEAKILGGFWKGKPSDPDKVKFKQDFQGLTIHVDRPKGFVMFGKDSKGNEWKRTYKYDYGFIPKTLGGDDDGLDVFIGPNKKAPQAFWAVQRKEDGSFDEYKIFVGFDNRDEAIAVYRAHIPKKFFGRMMTMTVEMMKAMLGTNPEEYVKKAAWNGFVRAVMGEL